MFFKIIQPKKYIHVKNKFLMKTLLKNYNSQIILLKKNLFILEIHLNTPFKNLIIFYIIGFMMKIKLF